MRENALKTLFSLADESQGVSAIAGVSSYFGERVLTLDKLRAHLSDWVYDSAVQCIDCGEKLSSETANAIATAAKQFAVSHGATHYTHWFHPLSGITAEKHDAFFDPKKNIETLKGDSLLQQEPDASSFPSGGIRSTFEARGYTIWDPSSPMFVWEETLCIPTVFIAYTGEALDYKTPLIRSSHAITKIASKVVRWFTKGVNAVQPMVGCEQEYFLIDRALCQARQDILLTGRTLIGNKPAKGQQFSDHYFGAIPARVVRYMKDLEVEAYKLGIPLKTRHNEVAPAQFEVAPIFEEANRATDHNQLLQHVMQRVANKHRFKVLFHEKPFAWLNGSGKHCNWSLRTNTDINLMDPGGDELLFLVFFVNTIMAVRMHEALLRASVASHANDLRMGGHEAPPAIMSVFIGEHLQRVLDNLQKADWADEFSKKTHRFFADSAIVPSIKLDNTDRNRTSPFAFTGNRFEFRAPGADINIARPIAVLNTIVAQQLTLFYEAVTAHATKDRRLAILEILRQYAQTASSIIFNGDGYSKAWVAEATTRKLSNIKDTPEALTHYTSAASVALFEQQKVLTKRELQARKNVDCEHYAMKISMEAHVLYEMICTQIIPTAVKQQHTFMESATRSKELGVPYEHLMALIKQIVVNLQLLRKEAEAMKEALKKIDHIADPMKKAAFCCHKIKQQYFVPIRQAADTLEGIIDDSIFPLVKYRELLFLR